MTEQSSPIRDLMSSSQPKYDIAYILGQACPQAPFTERAAWLQLLMGWLRPLSPSAQLQEFDPGLRLKFLLQILRRHPEWQAPFAGVLQQSFGTASGFSLFAYAGIPEQQGFFDQILQLSLDAFLPLAPEEGDLGSLLRSLFIEAKDHAWIAALPEDTVQDFLLLLTAPNPKIFWQNLYRDLLDAILTLATQIAALSANPSLWQRSHKLGPEQSPAFRLLRQTTQMTADLRQRQKLEPFHLIQLQMALNEAQEVKNTLEEAFAYVEQHGINLGLAWRMEYQGQLLQRYTLLCEYLKESTQGHGYRGALLLLSQLLQALYSSQNFREIWQLNARRLARRMIEHAGQSGEHYVTRNRQEYKAMLLSASGGGVLTVGTSLIKTAISSWGLPALGEAFLHTCNYVGSFLSMQALHLTLATKQPSVTASHLAVLMAKGQEEQRSQSILNEIRHVIRSQIAAVIGNIGLAIPTALLLASLVQVLWKKPLFSESIARYTVHSFDPLSTLTLFYAALTGVLLWLSSLFAAWLENGFNFHDIPARLTTHPLIKQNFGAEAGSRCAAFLHRNLAGIAGSIALGFLLALLPFLGKISGLPLDVRHVTLSAAQLCIALVSDWSNFSLAEISKASIGILAIGILNFGISFGLALTVALRAQNVKALSTRKIFRRFLSLLLTEPRSFLWPPADHPKDKAP